MKKLIALMMSLCLLMMSGAVLAETAAPAELKWSDYETMAASYPGEFVQLKQVALAFYLPNCLQEQELTEADVNEKGYLAYFTDAENGWNVAIQYTDVGGASLEEVAEVLKATEGVSGVALVKVNGIDAINYDVADENATVLTFVTEAGYGLEFYFGPLVNDNAKFMATVMAGSIQPYEE